MPRAKFNDKNPHAIFYWNDWINDPALKLCSFAAKGLWMDCLSLAATCVPYGHLSVEGRPLSPKDLQRLLSGQNGTEEIASLLDELVSLGVASRTAKGVIYSRRMVRDRHRSNIATTLGQRGGNPHLVINSGKIREKPPRDNRRVNPRVNPNTLSYTNITPLPPQEGEQDKIEINPKENGLSPRQNGTNPRALAAALVPPQDDASPWRKRVQAYKDKGFWINEWGVPPGQIGCRVDKNILIEAGFSQ